MLIPVLDDDKHYWVGDDEIEKLLRHGDGWLKNHPEHKHIISRYLKHRGSLKRIALERLLDEDNISPDDTQEDYSTEEERIEKPILLNDQRIDAVITALKEHGAKRVLDLGCGEGRLLKALLKDRSFEEIVGLDVSYRTLEIASDRLNLERLPDKLKERLKLIHGSLTYRDKRLEGYDAAAVIEVIEHLEPARLKAFERVLFEFSKPRIVIITTPNFEYNIKFQTLSAGKLRHRDHRFEWTREEFKNWAKCIKDKYGYSFESHDIGPAESGIGAPTQMGLFTHIGICLEDDLK